MTRSALNRIIHLSLPIKKVLSGEAEKLSAFKKRINHGRLFNNDWLQCEKLKNLIDNASVINQELLEVAGKTIGSGEIDIFSDQKTYCR